MVMFGFFFVFPMFIEWIEMLRILMGEGICEKQQPWEICDGQSDGHPWENMSWKIWVWKEMTPHKYAFNPLQIWGEKSRSLSNSFIDD